jgi:hypothetical protein
LFDTDERNVSNTYHYAPPRSPRTTKKAKPPCKSTTKGNNSRKPPTMQLQTAILALSATSATAAVYNPQLQVWDMGQIPTERGQTAAATFMGACGGIPDGGYACGWFESDGVNALRAIYHCVNSQMVRTEFCKENKKNNRCVKNSRQKGKRFCPFDNSDKIVCMEKDRVDAP